MMTSSPKSCTSSSLWYINIYIRRSTLAGFQLTKLFGIDDFSAARDSSTFRTIRFVGHHCDTLVFLSPEARDVAVRDSGDK